jgi:hypothetical protein
MLKTHVPAGFPQLVNKLYEQIQAISRISHNCVITAITGNKIYLRILIVKTAIHQRFVQLCE